jgi:hypothetical protein
MHQNAPHFFCFCGLTRSDPNGRYQNASRQRYSSESARRISAFPGTHFRCVRANEPYSSARKALGPQRLCVTSGSVASGRCPLYFEQHVARRWRQPLAVSLRCRTSAPDEPCTSKRTLQHDQTILTNNSLGYNSESPRLFSHECHAGSRCGCVLEQRRSARHGPVFAPVTRCVTELTQRPAEPCGAQRAYGASWRIGAVAFRGAAGDGPGHAGTGHARSG